MYRHLLLTAVLGLTFSAALHAESIFTGRWALNLPGGRAGWLGVEEKDGSFSSSILWGGGSVVPTTSTQVKGDTLIVTREQKNKEGKVTTETLTAKAEGDLLNLTTSRKNASGKEVGKAESFSGKRIPALPARPDLSKVKFGARSSFSTAGTSPAGGSWTIRRTMAGALSMASFKTASSRPRTSTLATCAPMRSSKTST